MSLSKGRSQVKSRGHRGSGGGGGQSSELGVKRAEGRRLLARQRRAFRQATLAKDRPQSCLVVSEDFGHYPRGTGGKINHSDAGFFVAL